MVAGGPKPPRSLEYGTHFLEVLRSEYRALWIAMLEENLDEGQRLAFTDGCGRQVHHSFLCHRTDQHVGASSTTGSYLCILVVVLDSERRGIAEALDSD